MYSKLVPTILLEIHLHNQLLSTRNHQNQGYLNPNMDPTTDLVPDLI